MHAGQDPDCSGGRGRETRFSPIRAGGGYDGHQRYRGKPGMTLFILSFVVFILAVVGLGAGLLLGRGSPRTSCGGNSVVRLCGICPAKERL